jgi:lysophospholipase L1-like esterase
MMRSINIKRKTNQLLPLYLSIVVILSGVAFSQAQTYKFDFGVASVAAVTGYTKVTTANLYTTTYANDNTNGVFGFENWDSLHLRGLNRVNPAGLNRDVIVGWNNNGFSSFYFSVRVPEGKYSVTFYIGDYGDTATTTIKAESRRMLVEKLHTAAGQIVTRNFTVMRKDSSIAGTTAKVGLDISYGREYPPICLSWDHKLTFEFSGTRPCIGGIDIVKVDTGITLHLCGNSTLEEQEDEPWTAWGQMVSRLFNSSVIVNNLGRGGETSSGFLSENRLKKICSVMNTGDYLFFEFGHNDSKTAGYETQFQANMQIFRDSAVAYGATMVFVTPVARRGDTDSLTSVSGSAELTRTKARSLGAKLIDLNAMSLRLKTALGANSTIEYAHFPASPLWPDQPLINDDTHFSDYGAYEVARCVLQNGLKAAGLSIYTRLLDTSTFNPSAPDDPTTWSIPYSLDTVFRHATPGATIRVDSTSPVAAKIINSRNERQQMYSLSVNPFNFNVAYSICAGGSAEMILYEFNGRMIAQKQIMTAKSEGSFQWSALDGLPAGMYYILMKINDKVFGETRFCKL